MFDQFTERLKEWGNEPVDGKYRLKWLIGGILGLILLGWLLHDPSIAIFIAFYATLLCVHSLAHPVPWDRNPKTRKDRVDD